MKSAAFVCVAMGQSDSAMRVAAQTAKVAAFVDDNGGQLHIVINASEMRMFEILDAVRSQNVQTVYVQDVTKLSVYAGKIISLLSILEELGVEVLNVADAGRVSGATLSKLAEKLSAQFERDTQLELGI